MILCPVTGTIDTAIIFRVVKININLLLNSLYGLSEKLCSRKFGPVVLEIAHVKFTSRKSPYKIIYGSGHVRKNT